MHPFIKKLLVRGLIGISLIHSCQPVLSQVMLEQGVPLNISKQLAYRGLSETFEEWWLFDPPVRQVALFRMAFGGDELGKNESLNVEIFQNSLDYFYGTNGTNMIFQGPTNQIQFITPLTWTTNTAYARVTMLVGSTSFTNINLATKSVGADGMADVYRTNISFLVPSPRLTLLTDNLFAPFYFQLLWPTNASGYRLEESGTLSQPAWTPVINFIGLSGTNHTHYFETYDPFGQPLPPRYFRLRKPF